MPVVFIQHLKQTQLNFWILFFFYRKKGIVYTSCWEENLIFFKYIGKDVSRNSYKTLLQLINVTCGNVKKERRPVINFAAFLVFFALN